MKRFSEEVSRLANACVAAASHLVSAALNALPVVASRKDDNTLVLNLDLESNEIIREALAGYYPLLSEEDPTSHHLVTSDATYVLVDPLDGTTSCRRFLSTVGGQVGFGPLLGLVREGHMYGASFYNVPSRTLYIAERGVGVVTFLLPSIESLKAFSVTEVGTQLLAPRCEDLTRAGVLFFAGTKGELPFIERLKRKGLVENVYRFGGFANDCARLAHGFEQVSVQFSVKPWDLSAAVIAELAGISIMVEPQTKCVPLSEWVVGMENPILAASPPLMPRLLHELGGVAQEL